MAHELVLLSKERYDSLLTQNQATTLDGKTPETEQFLNEDSDRKVQSTRSTTDPDPMKLTTLSKRGTKLHSRMKDKGKTILDHNDKGELIVNGNTIDGSDIEKIIRHITSAKSTTTPPTVSRKVRRAIKKIKIPTTTKTSQKGGLFVKQKGKRDTVPGEAKLKIDWIKY